MIINNFASAWHDPDTCPVMIRFQVWSFYTKLKYKHLLVIFFIDTISMEIRLAFLTENEIKCFMNDTMQTNIRKNT